jgi:hypothetical protein
VVSPNTLTDGVPKVPKASCIPFWHFWHCLIVGISLHAQCARVWSRSWWRSSVPVAERVCAKSPFIPCGAASKEAHLYARLQDVVSANAARLVETSLEDAEIAAWDVRADEKTSQKNLVISNPSRTWEPPVVVDRLKVAQFIYLLLKNEKLRRDRDEDLKGRAHTAQLRAAA